jgi:hypothetical protein
VVSLLLTIVVVVLICWAAIWILTQIAPGHPAVIDRLIWVLCVVVVALVLIQAFGIADVPVPRVR